MKGAVSLLVSKESLYSTVRKHISLGWRFSPILVVALRIETGLWQGKPVEERLCLVCNRGVVEDEFHFLCECQTYCALREDLFKSVNEFCPDFEDMEPREKFIYILKREGYRLLYSTSLFLSGQTNHSQIKMQVTNYVWGRLTYHRMLILIVHVT